MFRCCTNIGIEMIKSRFHGITHTQEHAVACQRPIEAGGRYADREMLIAPLRDQLKNEARGTSGDLPLLLRGLPI